MTIFFFCFFPFLNIRRFYAGVNTPEGDSPDEARSSLAPPRASPGHHTRVEVADACPD